MKPTDIDISTVIVTYRSADVIGRCLSTLAGAAQKLRTQLIVVDNGGDEKTAELLRGAEKLPFSEVRLCFNECNEGYTRAVNQGLALCRGRFVLLLNPDVEFVGDPFSQLLPLFDDPRLLATAPQLRYPDGSVQPSCRRFPRKRDVLFETLGLSRLFAQSAFFNGWRMPDFAHDHSRDVDQPQGAFLLMRGDLVQQLGPLDERFPMFFSDVDWCRRIWESGGRIRFCAETYVLHHRGVSVRRAREAMIVSSHRSFADYFAKYDRTALQRASTAVIRFLLLAALPLRLLPLKLLK